jgi:hypothetical protein
MSRTPRLLLAALALAAGSAAAADERADAAKEQKATAEANLKQANLTAAHVETDDLLVYATLPEEKAKPLAAAAQKAHATAVKALKVEAPDKLWPGKLTLYVFTEPRQYRVFALLALKQSVRNQETYRFDVRGDTPAVLDGLTAGEKPTAEQLVTDAATLTAAAVLSRQAGAGAVVPEWLLLGFGKAAYLRSEGNATRLAAQKGRVRSYYTKTRGAAFTLKALADGEGETDLVGFSLAEYLAFGPEAAKFPTLLGALKPSDDVPMPTVESALGAVDWKWDAMENAWRKWVTSGR